MDVLLINFDACFLVFLGIELLLKFGQFFGVIEENIIKVLNDHLLVAGVFDQVVFGVFYDFYQIIVLGLVLIHVECVVLK